MRVLITGMGGELGSRVAALLETERSVSAIGGVDVDPPRRRLRRETHFFRIDPRDRVRTVRAVHDLAPTALVHCGVYEPHARVMPSDAAERTIAGTVAALDAAVQLGELEAIVLRSGIEVYGRRRGAPAVPDESVPVSPTSAFGHTLVRAESLTLEAARTAGARLGILRLAPVVGPHVPSPLGRYLRLPVVGFSGLADPAFSLLHAGDAARAIVHALVGGADGTYNVVAAGAVTASQAARLGSRIPLPVAAPAWPIVARAAELAGAPLASHVVEVLRRGRSADGGRIIDELGFVPARSTIEVVHDLYEWAPVTPLRAVA